MPTSITVTSPSDFDVGAFAESTRSALTLLAPWCRLQDSPQSVPVEEIVTQALEYVGAINLSISAAQAGFTVAEEAISLAEVIPTTSVSEQRAYMKGMLELVNEARTNAEKTHETFRNVRQRVYALTEKTKAQMVDTSGLYNSTRQRSVQASATELRDGVAVLERFADQVSKFIDWWGWMKIESGSQQTEKQILTSSLIDKSVVIKWRQVKAQYALYTDMIAQMQDAYPHLFNATKHLEQQQLQRDHQADGRRGPQEQQIRIPLESQVRVHLEREGVQKEERQRVWQEDGEEAVRCPCVIM